MDKRGKTVVQRWRPQYAPLGVRAGSFVIHPSLTIAEIYSDNIFRTSTSETSDFVTRFIPRVRVSSDWNNHSLSAVASGNIGRYQDNSFEDYEDYTLGVGGRLDVRRGTNVKARLRTRRRHEDRSSPDDAGGRHPTEYDVHSAELEGFHRLNRLNFTLGFGLDQYDFEDSSTGVGTINNDDRDRDVITTFLRVGYQVIPNFEAFLRMTYNNRDYRDGMDDAMVDRDSDGYEAVAGVRIDFGGITFGDFFLGYRKQMYESATLNDVGGPSVGADITWNVTPLTTFVGSISREIRETTSGGASGSFFTTVAVNAQHELLRNLILEGDLSYSNNDFRGTSRSDDFLRGGLSANYLMNRYFSVRGGYEYRERESNIVGADYTENVVFVRLLAQY
jgi:hypothetical protein